MDWEAVVGICTVVALIGGGIGWLIGRRDRKKDAEQGDIDKRIDRSFVTHGHDLDNDRNQELGSIADKVNDLGDVELDIIPDVVQVSLGSNDEAQRYVVADVTNIGARPAVIRNAYIETSDRIPLRACWTVPSGNNHTFTDWQQDSPLCFTLMPGRTCQLIFAVRTATGPTTGTIVVPDYYPAPWGHLSTALRVVVECANAKDPLHSKHNDKLRAFADWVAKNRSKPQPSRPNVGYAIKGVNVPHGRT